MSEQTTTTNSVDLHRGLKNRHLQLIAIGGAIGTGLFMGSGKLISISGPSALLVYAIIGFVLFFAMRALGELLLSNLHYKTFGDIAKDVIGPWAGFFLSWTYWFAWIVACIADIVAIVGYVSYFNASVPHWLPALVAILTLTVLNLLPVKMFGETEFWFALIKIVAIVALIITGLVLLISGFTNPDTGTQASVSNLWEHGGFFPTGITGMFLGFQMGIFAFNGMELIGTTAAETENPRKNLPKAINSIVVRILLFYVGALAIIMMITPWNEIDPGESPFVTTLAYAGLGIAAAVINLVVLTSAASSANSGLYSDTRMLFNLAHDGHAPQALARTDKRNVPTRAVLTNFCILLLAIPLLYAGDSVSAVFTFVASMCSILGIVIWSTIVVSYIFYMKKYPERHLASKFKVPFSKVSPWGVLVFFVFVVGTLLYGDDTRLAVVSAPVWFIVIAVAWKIRKNQLIKEGKPITRVIPTIPHPLDSSDE